MNLNKVELAPVEIRAARDKMRIEILERRIARTRGRLLRDRDEDTSPKRT